jgi:hypothetical protein
MPLAACARLHPWEVVPLGRGKAERGYRGVGGARGIDVEHRSESAFVLLLQLADRHFSDAGFEDALADSLRDKATLIELWETWSADQRWTPSAYVEEMVAGWFDGARRHMRVHPDQAAAVADSIHRVAAWLSRRAVVTVDG